jgi:hypothetical protein
MNRYHSFLCVGGITAFVSMAHASTYSYPGTSCVGVNVAFANNDTYYAILLRQWRGEK